MPKQLWINNANNEMVSSIFRKSCDINDTFQVVYFVASYTIATKQ